MSDQLTCPVAIVIPFLNRSAYFSRLLNSIRHQSLQPLEVIIVDNGSRYEEVEAINSHCLQYPDLNILLVSTCTRFSGNDARNLGFFLASSQYVAFLDSDDDWLPDHLKTAMSIFNFAEIGKDLVAVYSGSTILAQHSAQIKMSRQIGNQESAYDFLLGVGHGFAQSSGFVVPTKLRDSVCWDPSLSRLQDIDFFICVSQNARWIYSSFYSVVIDWEENRTKKIDFVGFKTFYEKHRKNMRRKTATRLLLFTLKECAVRSGSDEDYAYISSSLAKLGFAQRIISFFARRSLVLNFASLLHSLKNIRKEPEIALKR